MSDTAYWQGILQFLGIKETLANIALSHHESCCCDPCLAAYGDKDAYYRCWIQLTREDDV